MSLNNKERNTCYHGDGYQMHACKCFNSNNTGCALENTSLTENTYKCRLWWFQHIYTHMWQSWIKDGYHSTMHITELDVLQCFATAKCWGSHALCKVHVSPALVKAQHCSTSKHLAISIQDCHTCVTCLHNFLTDHLTLCTHLLIKLREHHNYLFIVPIIKSENIHWLALW